MGLIIIIKNNYLETNVVNFKSFIQKEKLTDVLRLLVSKLFFRNFFMGKKINFFIAFYIPIKVRLKIF